MVLISSRARECRAEQGSGSPQIPRFTPAIKGFRRLKDSFLEIVLGFIARYTLVARLFIVLPKAINFFAGKPHQYQPTTRTSVFLNE